MKQILVVIGGIPFTSIPVGEYEAQYVMESFARAAPNCDPILVEAQEPERIVLQDGFGSFAV